MCPGTAVGAARNALNCRVTANLLIGDYVVVQVLYSCSWNEHLHHQVVAVVSWLVSPGPNAAKPVSFYFIP